MKLESKFMIENIHNSYFNLFFDFSGSQPVNYAELKTLPKSAPKAIPDAKANYFATKTANSDFISVKKKPKKKRPKPKKHPAKKMKKKSEEKRNWMRWPKPKRPN